LIVFQVVRGGRGDLAVLESKYSIDMSIRHIYGIEWKDDLAWMEGMSGRSDAIQKEKAKWKEVLDIKTASLIEKELIDLYTYTSPPYTMGRITIVRLLQGYVWHWTGTRKRTHAIQIHAEGDHVWYIEDTSAGAEHYTLFCLKHGRSTPVWKKTNVSPNFAIIGKRCYMLEARKILSYWKLVSCDAQHGSTYTVHYEELKPNYILNLIGCGSIAYMTRSSGSMCDLFELTEHTLTKAVPHSTASRRFVFDTQKGYLVWTGGGGGGAWKVSKALSSWRLTFDNAVPEYIDTSRGLYLTKWLGVRTLWRISCEHNEEPVVLWKGVGQIMFSDKYMKLIQPGGESHWFSKIPKGISIDIHTATWGDTHVPYVIIPPKKGDANKLLVIGYGAYGNPTSLDTTRWEPLLRRGWYLCIGFWRGGGDHTPEWEDAGKKEGRVNVLKDAYAVVKEAQRLTQTCPMNTVLYGRSAGGLWVGGLSSLYGAALARGAYMEVPYLDVLRTTTNASLPLTEVELDEFGMPLERFSDFISVVQWSPMETLPKDGTDMFQIIRTAENDSQVLPYESMKWVHRCRGKGPEPRPIYLAYEHGQGHFIRDPFKLAQTNAEDLSVLLSMK
jgi:hypothetical protein